jgi:integrase
MNDVKSAVLVSDPEWLRDDGRATADALRGTCGRRLACWTRLARGLSWDETERDEDGYVSRLCHGQGRTHPGRSVWHTDRRGARPIPRLRRAHQYAALPALWLGQRGALDYSSVAVMLAKRTAAAGLQRLHARQFRHTFAHEYLAAGGQEGDLQRLAGWCSPLMLRRYGASVTDQGAQAAYTSPADRL